MSKGKTNTFVKVIMYIILILVVLAAIGLILRFTNGGTTDFKTFYVKIGETLYTENAEIELSEPVRVETKYVFASNKAEKHKGYNVKIVPNVTEQTKFDFKVDGQVHAFSLEKDFTSAFDIQRDETGFTIKNPATVEDVLKAVYSGKTVTLPQNLNASEAVYFNMVVSAYNDSSSITFGLRLRVNATVIKLDKNVLEFWYEESN